MIDLRDKILNADDKVIESVYVPEWDTEVYVRSMTARERDNYESKLFGKSITDLEDIRATLLVYCICDENGERLFKDEDIEALSSKAAKAVDKIFAVAQRLNGVTEEDIEDLKKSM